MAPAEGSVESLLPRGGRQGLECSSQTPRCLGKKLGKNDSFVLAN